MSNGPEAFKTIDIDEAKDTKKIRGLIDQAERNFSARLPLFSILARERFAQFEEYKKVGFTEAEALRLIIADIMRPASAIQ